MSSNQPKAKVLRIGLFQNNRIIEERLLRTPSAVTLGSDFKKNTFVVPGSDQLPRSMVVFDVKNGQYVLNITEKMTGRVKMGDSINTLQELIASGKAQRGAAGHTLPLTQSAQGRVALGEATLLFQFVTPPPPRAKPVLPASMRGGWIQGLDRILVGSISATAVLFIGFVLFLELNDWPVQLEQQQLIQDRFVQILVEEEKPVIEPEPVEAQPTDGDGEPSEEAPEPAPEKKPDPKPDKPAEEPASDKKPRSADEQARLEAERKRRLAADVQNKTILGQIGAVSTDGSSGSLVDILSEGAGRTSMDDAFKGSDGIKTGVAGAEKSGMRSSGSAGAEGTGSAVGGVELGRSSGADKASQGVGTGEKTQEKKVKAKVDMRGEQRAIGGQLDSNAISKALQLKSSAFQACYERELKKNPKAGGKVVVMFMIGSAGRVTSSKATTDSVGGGTGQCVADVISKIRFPKPTGGDVTVNKSFVFSASS